MASSDVLLDRRARPQGAQRIFILVVALVAGAAGAWLTTAIDAEGPRWALACGIGLGLAAGVIFFAMQGARVVVGANRVLTYSLHGRPNLAFDLALATAFRPLAEGLVHGVGVELSDPQQVRFLHKTGISPEQMRRWREQFGVDLVLEGFPSGLADSLLALREAQPAAGASG